MKIKIKLKEGGKLPCKATSGAVAYDAYVRDYEVLDGGLIKYYLGFSTEIPDGYRGIIAARSSLSNTIFCIPNGYGIVDCDYRGEYQFRIRPILDLNSNQFLMEDIVKSSIPYQIGDRCCQIYFEKVDVPIFDVVSELSETDRGEGGFGSTKK